jgi:hypothetical protein
MVFTDWVTGFNRRRLLGAAAGTATTALAGCGPSHHEPAPHPSTDVLRPLLDEAVALVAAYDRAVLAQPGLGARLTPLAADHRAHAAEIARLIGTSVPSAAPSAGASANPGDVLTRLRSAEQAAQRTAATVCIRAAGGRATLAGSIAACRATHAEALR